MNCNEKHEISNQEFKEVFEKVFCEYTKNKEDDFLKNDIDYCSILINYSECLKKVQKDIEKLEINNINKEKIYYLSLLNNIYISKNSTKEEKMTSMKLQEILKDKLINCVKNKIKKCSK